MKLYLARLKSTENSESYVMVFPTAKERAQYVQREEGLGREYIVEKRTCEFPATKEGIVAFFNRHAMSKQHWRLWHWQ